MISSPFGSNYKKQTFECHQNIHHPYKSYFSKKESYPRYHIDHAGYHEMYHEINGFLHQNQENYHQNVIVHKPAPVTTYTSTRNFTKRQLPMTKFYVRLTSKLVKPSRRLQKTLIPRPICLVPLPRCLLTLL